MGEFHEVSKFSTDPTDAWRLHLAPAVAAPNWIEDSSAISTGLPFSKRELFGLILLAHLCQGVYPEAEWLVGYDPMGVEPNDGYVTDGAHTFYVEHKLVPCMAHDEVLDVILSTYAKYAAYGSAYGGNRVLLIHANKASQGSVPVSNLHHEIAENCPFDRVLLIMCVTMAPDRGSAVFHLSQQHPELWIGEVRMDFRSGEAAVPEAGIKGVDLALDP